MKQSSASPREWTLFDCWCVALNTGVEAVIEDQVTNCFETMKFGRPWNLLSRNNGSQKMFMVDKDVVLLNVLWVAGIVIRYVLLPFKLALLVVSTGLLVPSTFLVSCIGDVQVRRSAYSMLSVSSFRFLACAFSSVIRTNNKENMVRHGICVANHTSPIDAMVLGCDRAYTLVGQRDNRGLYGTIYAI